jgi:hypothetical protein
LSYAPLSIRGLASYWVSKGGVNLGIVGDTAHVAKGFSYHLGKDYLAPDAYSIKTARDKAGLTNAASAIDLGALGDSGNYGALRAFSRWLVGQGQKNAAGTSDIREIIYTPDGKVVMRWDRERGFASAPRPGEADNSHLYHTHISFYRDSEERSKVGLFTPFWVAPPTPVIPTVHVAPNSYFWPYKITGVKGAYTITRPSTSTLTKTGFTAKLGVSRIDILWSGSTRRFAKIEDSASAYNGIWLNLLEGPNITVS